MTYAEVMAARLPPALSLPEEFHALLDWMEANGSFMASAAYPGDRLGLLGTEEELQAGSVTAILFRIATPAQAQQHGEAWFGAVVPDIGQRLVPFARTGSDGSLAAFWRDDDGQRHIVHLGSEGHACLLGATPLGFLRLLAIGYAEIGGDCLDHPDAPPNGPPRNGAYRAWLVKRYGVTIPLKATDLIVHGSASSGDASDDPFARWVHERQAAAR